MRVTMTLEDGSTAAVVTTAGAPGAETTDSDRPTNAGSPPDVLARAGDVAAALHDHTSPSRDGGPCDAALVALVDAAGSTSTNATVAMHAESSGAVDAGAAPA